MLRVEDGVISAIRVENIIQYADVVRTGEVVVRVKDIHTGVLIVVMSKSERMTKLMAGQILPPHCIVLVIIIEALPIKANQCFVLRYV